MHHTSSGRPPAGGRLASLRRTGRPLRTRAARLALGTALFLAVTAVFVGAPVVSGTGSWTTASWLDASPSPSAAYRSTESESPVVMGVDGGPVASSWFAGATASGTTAPASESETAEVQASDVQTPEAQNPDVAAPAPATTGAAPAPATTPEGPATDPAPSTIENPAPAAGSSSVTPPPPAPASVPPPPPAAAPAAGSAPAAQVLALVNSERAAAGCGAVVADAGLAGVAAAHSADMRDRGYFDHVNLDGLDPFDRAERAGLSARAENIAMGQPDAASVMSAWMGSSGHRANILNCALTRLGVGVAEGTDGPWWTQLFG